MCSAARVHMRSATAMFWALLTSPVESRVSAGLVELRKLRQERWGWRTRAFMRHLAHELAAQRYVEVARRVMELVG